MAFLTLNGVTIPTASGGAIESERIGETMRSYLGTAVRDSRGVKRRWKFRTPPLSVTEALALRAFIRGTGLLVTFDEGDANGDGGLVPSADTLGTDAYSAAAAADGYDSVLVSLSGSSTPLAAARGAYSGWFSPASENIYTADLRDCEGAATVLTKVEAAYVTLTSDTTHKWQGSKSIKVDCAAYGSANVGVTTGAVTVNASSTYTGSVWLKGAAGGEQVDVALLTGLGGGSLMSVTLSATEWTRVQNVALTGASTTLALSVLTTNAGDAFSFYCDGFQLEELSHATAWVDGARVADAALSYSPRFLDGSAGVTIAAWVCPQYLGYPTDGCIAELYADANNRINIYISTDGYFEFDVMSGGSVTTITDSVTVNDTQWYHIAAIFNETTLAMELYIDGASAASGTADGTVGIGAGALVDDGLTVGNVYAGSASFGGLIDDLMVLPFVATAGMVAGWVDTSALPVATVDVGLPRLVMSGDIIGSDVATVIGEVTAERITGTQQGASWDSAARAIEFTLTEV